MQLPLNAGAAVIPPLVLNVQSDGHCTLFVMSETVQPPQLSLNVIAGVGAA